MVEFLQSFRDECCWQQTLFQQVFELFDVVLQLECSGLFQGAAGLRVARRIKATRLLAATAHQLAGLAEINSSRFEFIRILQAQARQPVDPDIAGISLRFYGNAMSA